MTGPIVAFIDADNAYHEWAVAQFARLRPPLLTCEAVLAEAFLISRAGRDGGAVVELVEHRVLKILPLFDEEAATISRLMRRFKNVPMSLADACLVRLVELTNQATLFAVNSDFEIYRQKVRCVIPVLAPKS